ncbi:MAG: hypothetical protein ACF8Q5_06535 [Phycisphaerales bacterium JB040]
MTSDDTTTIPGESERTDLATRIRIWLARATVSGVLISLFIHLLIILVTRFIDVSYSRADAGGGPAETVSFEIVTEAEAPASTEQLTVTLPTSSDLNSPAVDQLDPVEDLTTAAEAIDPVGELDQGFDQPSGAAGAASDIAAGAGAAGSGAGASFFGLEAVGRRFCYIIDVSGSMRQGPEEARRIDIVKQELTRSLQALIESSEFAVVLYAGRSGWLFTERQWLDSTQRNKLVARARIAGIELEYSRTAGVGRYGVTEDGTYPSSAIEKAMSLNPRPDAIYLLTDGEFQESGVPEFTRNLNRTALIPIHCLFITDDNGGGAQVQNTLRTIASESGGSFRNITP